MREGRVRANGIELAYFEWNEAKQGDGPTLLLAHATGFHARCWDPLVGHLGDRHLVAVDMRGHGRSDKTPIDHWDVFGQDLAGLVRALDLRQVLGVGHSMGGHAMVDAAAALPERFLRLVLIDPVIAAPDQYGVGGWKISTLGGEPHPTAKRKRHFGSVEEMIARFRDRVPYRGFDSAALHAYCTYGLLPAAEGDGFELACPPEIEASIYMTSRTNKAVHDSVRALEIPALVVRVKLPPADRSVMDFSSSPTWPGLAGEFLHGREIHFAERSHFLPQESPREVAELIVAEAEASAS